MWLGEPGGGGGACTKFASCLDDIPLQSGLCWVIAQFRTSSTKTVVRIWGIPSITNYALVLVWLYVCVCVCMYFV